MRLWSIQSVDAYEQLETNGTLYADTRIVEDNEIFYEAFQSAYEWMVQQMLVRLKEQPPSGVKYPLWGWYQWNGEHHRRPDLRGSGHVRKGTAAVRIELAIPDDKVLLSDFESFHYALNFWYLPLNSDDDDRFDLRLKENNIDFHEIRTNHASTDLQKMFRREIIKSWDRVFDLDWYEEDICHHRSDKAIQATFWEIRTDWVRSVKFFRGR